MTILLTLTSEISPSTDVEANFFQDFEHIAIEIPYLAVPDINDSICLLGFHITGAPGYWYDGDNERYDSAVKMLGRLWTVQAKSFYFADIRLTLCFEPTKHCQPSELIREGFPI